MDIAQRTKPMPSLVRNYDGLIVCSYAAFAVVLLVAIYFASGGPSYTNASGW